VAVAREDPVLPERAAQELTARARVLQDTMLDSTQKSHGVDATAATFSVQAGPRIAAAVAEEWLAFHAYVERELQPPGRAGPAAPAYPPRRTTLGVRLSADWAWAAVPRAAPATVGLERPTSAGPSRGRGHGPTPRARLCRRRTGPRARAAANGYRHRGAAER
jgi:hypothetical protein